MCAQPVEATLKRPSQNPARDDLIVAQGQDASFGFTLQASATLGKTLSEHSVSAARLEQPNPLLPAPLKPTQLHLRSRSAHSASPRNLSRHFQFTDTQATNFPQCFYQI